MTRRYCLRFIFICFPILSLCSSLFVNAQTGEYKVWVRTSPCSGRFDWISVAKENPTGGLNFYYAANVIFPGTSCTMLGCTFPEATIVANSLRGSDEFFKYCCREYSVWENPQTGKKSIVVGKFGTAGPPWQFVKGDLCCEEAEALAGITGACSGTTHTNHDDEIKKTKCWPGSYPSWNEQTQRVECYCLPGKVWNNTKTACVDTVSQVNCWPGSYAAYNPQTKRTECYCNPGLVWNSTKTACIEPVNADCSMYEGSIAVMNEQTQKWECRCPEGKIWNSARTACIDKVSEVTCWPGSYAAFNPQTNRTECYCNPGLIWNSTKTACIDPKELVKNADCSIYPGTKATWNEQTQKVECRCPEGKTWNSERNACVDNVTQINCWPGSYAALNTQTNRTECYCNQGLVWNATKTACIDPKELVRNSDCSIYPGTTAAWNEQTQKVECRCPEGKTWNSERNACVDNVSQVNCWPGSYAAFNSQTNRTECYCNQGLVWNATKTACVDPKELAKNTDCSMYPGSYATWNQQTNRMECWCPEGKVWNSTKTACVDKTGTTTTGGPVWTLISTTSVPAAPYQGWTFSAQGGTAHWDIYNGDKADFQWTPPPQQITGNGFTITVSSKSSPAPNSRLAVLIGLGGSGFTTDSPSEQGALANYPEGQPSAQKTMKCIPSTSATEIEVKIELMWGDVKFYYKYKRL